MQTAARRRAKDAERRLERIVADPVPRPPARLRLDVDLGREGTPSSGVRVRDLHVPGRLRLARLDVPAGEHLLVTGPNGCGKSTLLRALADAPRHRGVDVGGRVARLAQDTAFDDPRRSPQQLVAAQQGIAEDDARAVLLPLGLVHPRDAARPVGDPASASSAGSPSPSSSWPARTSFSSTSRRTTCRSPSSTSSRRPSTRRPPPCSSPATTAGCGVDGPHASCRCPRAATYGEAMSRRHDEDARWRG